MELIKKNLIGKEIPGDYDYIFPFSEGLARVKRDGWYNFIDKDGKELLDLDHYRCKDFNEGLAAVCCPNGAWGFINKEGKRVIKPNFYNVHSFNEGMAAFMQYRDSGNNSIFREEFWGFINKEGKVIVDSKYKEVDKFSDGLAAVLSSTGWGFIDKEGKEVIEPVYKAVNSFKNGIGAVLKEDGWHNINKEGKIVPNYSSTDIKPIDKEEYIPFKKDGKWYIADSNNLTYEVSIELGDKIIKKTFNEESKADDFIKIMSAYINGRLARKESEENEVKRKIEHLIEKEKKNIIRIYESYVEDVEKEIKDCYKKSMN